MVLYTEIKLNDVIPSVTVKMDWTMYKKYNRLVHEINPLHFNEQYAKSLGFDAIVVAGVFTYAFYLRPILYWTKDSNSIRKVNIRFHKPVYLEDEVTQGATVVNKFIKDGQNYIECDIWAKNQKGEPLISGSVLILIEN